MEKIFIPSSRYASESELYRDPMLKLSERVMLRETLMTFDRARELHGGPLIITSGRRSIGKQDELRKQGYRAASISPHCFGAALDVRVPVDKADEYLTGLIRQASQDLSFPRPRIGYRQYRLDGKTKKVVGAVTSSTFVHYDFAFLLKGEVDVPERIWEAWREGVEW